MASASGGGGGGGGGSRGGQGVGRGPRGGNQGGGSWGGRGSGGGGGDWNNGGNQGGYGGGNQGGWGGNGPWENQNQGKGLQTNFHLRLIDLYRTVDLHVSYDASLCIKNNTDPKDNKKRIDYYILKVEDGIKADRVVITAVAIGAMTTSVVAISRVTVAVQCAIILTQAVGQHRTALIRVLAAGNQETRDGCHPSVDKVKDQR